MSYYGVSVTITVLTSLTAFYLLYKARELNLGILISVAAGSVILGFSINPAFNGILSLLSDNININEKLALIVSILIILFIFLVSILVLSIVISIAIPKKFTAIDCCVYIDRFLERAKEKIVPEMKELAKNVYDLKNKLKKPVDTKQIIDTMGIEKSEKEIFVPQTAEMSVKAVGLDIIDYTDVEPFDFNNRFDTFEFMENTGAMAAVAESETAVEHEVEYGETAETEEYTFLIDSAEPEYTASVDSTVESEDYAISIPVEVEEDLEEETLDADTLVMKAFKCKESGKKAQAIEYYIDALQYNPDKGMIFWIVLDVCTLYKQLGLNDLAVAILEGTVAQYGDIIRPEIKVEIMNNLK